MLYYLQILVIPLKTGEGISVGIQPYILQASRFSIIFICILRDCQSTKDLPVRFLPVSTTVLASSLIIDSLGRSPFGNEFPNQNTYYLPKWEMASTPSCASRLLIAREQSLHEPEAAIPTRWYSATTIYRIVLIDIVD